MSTEPAQRTETAVKPGVAGANGAARPGEVPPAEAAAPARATPLIGSTLRRLLFVGLALVVLATGSAVGYRFWYDSTHYVSTNNAQLAGRLVQVGTMTAGRVAAVRYDVGDRVTRDSVVATLHVAVPVGMTSSGAPRLEFRETSDSLVEVRSPVSGVVIARAASPNDTVPAGQSILTIVDPEQLWVTANIEETQIRRVQPGQAVAVHVDALDIDLRGRVVAITPASAATSRSCPARTFPATSRM
jgi:multidrug resistance efflux pump